MAYLFVTINAPNTQPLYECLLNLPVGAVIALLLGLVEIWDANLNIMALAPRDF